MRIGVVGYGTGGQNFHGVCQVKWDTSVQFI